MKLENYNTSQSKEVINEIAQLIDKATEDLVRERFFRGLSIQEVCERAEVEPSLFYRRDPESFTFYVEKFIRDHDLWLSHYEQHTPEGLQGTLEELTEMLLSLRDRLSTDKMLKSFLCLKL